MARPRRPELHPRLVDFRRRAGLTQEQVADRIGITAEMVRRHERGISLPIELYRQRYSTLYQATQSDLGLRPGSNPVSIGNRTSPDDTDDGTSLIPRIADAHTSPTLRSITGGPIWVPEYADAAYLATIHGHIQQLVALDIRFGGADLAKLAERFFRAVHNRLGTGAYEPGIRKDLLSAAGELAEVAGWLAYDADRQDTVRRMNQESLYLTRLAGDKKMELLTLQNASMHAGFLSRPHEALDIANFVLDGDFRLSPRLRAMFLTRRARALAQGGDAGSLQIFKEIHSLYLEGVGADDPDWAWWVDERGLAWHKAMCQQDLGNSSAAIIQFEQSVEATSSTHIRDQYLHCAYLLAAQVNLRSWAAAENTMLEIEPLATEVASPRTVVLLRRILGQLRTAGSRVPAGVVECGVNLTHILDTAPV